MWNKHEEVERPSRIPSFMLGALIGAAAGAAVALLYAPKPGRKLRADLARTYERATSQLNDLGEMASDVVERAKEKFVS